MAAIKRRKFSREVTDTISGWALLMPTLVFLLMFTVFPILRSLYLSFHELDLSVREPVFNGIRNYKKLFSSSLFWKVILNSLYFTLLTVIPSMIVGLLLAVLVNRGRKITGFLRTAFFYPAVMPMIAIASIWMFIYMAKNGLFDQLLLSLGLKPMAVLSNRKTVLPAMAFMYVWKEAGYLMIFFLSGLQNVDTELYEAARIDGSSGVNTFFKITIPMLLPTFLFVSTIELTNSFKLVDHIVIMTEGAPNNASTLLLYYIYQQGFTYFDQGMASTLTVIMLVIMMLIAMTQFVKADKKIYYN
jgi:sn-glycerol 3-phosphate transport system permease protein